MVGVQNNFFPQLSTNFSLTDGGIETSAIFNEGDQLPYLDIFDLLKNSLGCEALHNYFSSYAQLARKYELGLILENPTWRASQCWGDKLRYSTADLAILHRKSIQLLQDIRDEYETDSNPILISGCIEPRVDGYNSKELMTEAEAESYHSKQIKMFRSSAVVDLVTAITMTYAEEAIGICRAAENADIPVVISFSVETNGQLPSGQSLENAIEQVDYATNGAPLYYMIDCPDANHFDTVLPIREGWLERIHGLRANVSITNHGELNQVEELDDNNSVPLPFKYESFNNHLSSLKFFGDYSNTSICHQEKIYPVCLSLFLTTPTFF